MATAVETAAALRAFPVPVASGPQPLVGLTAKPWNPCTHYKLVHAGPRQDGARAGRVVAHGGQLYSVACFGTRRALERRCTCRAGGGTRC